MPVHTIGSDVWIAAREEMREILIDFARANKSITYSDLVARVHAMELDPHEPAIGKLLEEISTTEYRMGHGMLSVIVVHKSGDRRPGAGFYELASRLGKNVSDEDKCWIEEYSFVMNYWKTH